MGGRSSWWYSVPIDVSIGHHQWFYWGSLSEVFIFIFIFHLVGYIIRSYIDGPCQRLFWGSLFDIFCPWVHPSAADCVMCMICLSGWQSKMVTRFLFDIGLQFCSWCHVINLAMLFLYCTFVLMHCCLAHECDSLMYPYQILGKVLFWQTCVSRF